MSWLQLTWSLGELEAFQPLQKGRQNGAQLRINFLDSKWSQPLVSPYPIPVNSYRELEDVPDV